MKRLHTVDSGPNKWVLAILDDKNYVLFDDNKKTVGLDRNGREIVSYKHSYFSQMDHALRELTRRLADEACCDLSSWVKCLVESNKALVDAVSA